MSFIYVCQPLAPYNTLSKHSGKTKMVAIYQNQRTCGDSVIQAFRESYQHVVLLAQMQMGKSGTYWHVICNMLANTDSSGVENVIVISGNRETELRRQVHQDRKDYTRCAIEQIVDGCELSKDDDSNTRRNRIRELRVLMEERITVLWGHQLTPKKTDFHTVLDNTLIVWDEAHYAQSKDNSPHAWMKHNGLDTLLNGADVECAKRRNIRLLTVSATPFSELLIQSIQTQSFKKILRLEPDDSYCGVERYLNNGRVFESFDVKKATSDEVKELLSKYNNIDYPRYSLIRVPANRYASVFRTVCEELGMRFCVMNTDKQDISVEDLRDEPTRPTVVLVTGMLRMGKVVPKEHIAMVFESSVSEDNSNTKKTDTGLQGLFGRVCGHTPQCEGFDIDIYVDDVILAQAKRYVEGYEAVTGPLNDNAMNVRKAHSRPREMDIDHITKHTMPIKVCLSDEAKATMFNESGTVKKKAMREWLMANRDTLEMPGLTDEERERVSIALSSLEKVNGVVFKNLNSENLNTFTEAIYSSVQQGKPMFRKKISSVEADVITVSKWAGNEDDYPPHIKSVGGSMDDIWMTVTLTYPKSDEELASRNEPLYMIHPKCVFLPSPVVD